MLCVPTPAVVGLKVFPVIPGPLNVPPGVVGVNVTEGLLEQEGVVSPVKVASQGACASSFGILDSKRKAKNRERR
jgi:hypothetical protein